jgi:hypothetical protein
MAEFWIGAPGELSTEQLAALSEAGIAVDDFRQLATGRSGHEAVVIAWEVVRTFVRVPAEDESQATAKVAEALRVDARDLRAYSAEIFR